MDTNSPDGSDDNRDDQDEPHLPKLSKSILEVIRKAKSRAWGRGLEVVLTTTPNKVTVTKSDIKTLIPNNGLNNIIMDSYLELIGHRSDCNNEQNTWPSVYVFQSYFYKIYLDMGYPCVRNLTRYVNIFAHDLLLLPIHLIDHWGLAAVDFRIKTIKYYDSLGGEYPECFKVVQKYLRQEFKDKKQSTLRMQKWKTETVKDIPTQVNEYDCGIFACKYAEYLSRDAKFTFKQKDMTYYRKRMIYEIVCQDLMYP